MIKVYTTETCIYCHALMNWLEESGIAYEEADARTADAKITSVPTTVITADDSREIATIVGFDRPAIKKALQELKNA